jgi:murein L,D-transpeptidase YcbB/YkuD
MRMKSPPPIAVDLASPSSATNHRQFIGRNVSVLINENDRGTAFALASLFVLLISLCACSAHATDIEAQATDIRATLASMQQTTLREPAEHGRMEALQAAYALHDFAPLWSRNGIPTVQAISLIKTLRTADKYGLRARDYVEGLGSDPSVVPVTNRESHIAFGADFDVALSFATLQFLRDIHFGRIDPAAAGFHLQSARPPMDLDGLLLQLASTDDIDAVIASIEPQFYHYQLLEQALVRYRLLESGAATASAGELMTAPYTRRIRQIELTLERWRWLPAFTSPPIIVNIPQFRLFAFQSTRDRKAEILQMDVIVGRTYPKLQTPVFTADMKYVIFRPYWDVPYSITQREMLPQIRANPNYLSKEHLQIVRGPGDSATVVPPSSESIHELAAGALRLRQQPGEDNALGLIKFMLPNTYNVYLHSTPAHRLFSQSRRAFSHGCIRVSDPVALATYVLNNAPGSWTPESITAAMNGPGSVRVNLTKPIRVLVLYATALATEDGKVLFFEDIYGHDRKLEKLLALEPVTGS